MVFPVVRYGCELDYKESWVPKNQCFWTVVLEKTLESPLDCKEFQPVHPNGNQSWIFIGRTDVETPILWPPDAKSWLIWKDPYAGKRLKEGEEDHREWDGWMASPTEWIWVWVNSGSWWWTGRPGVHGVAESDTTEWLNWTESTSNRWDSSQGFWESASQITILSLARIKFLLFFLHWLLNFHWLLSHCFIDCWVLRGL